MFKEDDEDFQISDSMDDQQVDITTRTDQIIPNNPAGMMIRTEEYIPSNKKKIVLEDYKNP